MSADGALSDSSSLSSLSPVPSDVELDVPSDLETAKPKKAGILKFFPKLTEQPPREPSPPPRKRSPSPPHEYLLADNPDIAFIVMFRSRFSDAFAKSLAQFGPQELERDVVQTVPGDRVEHFLCALLGLILNRKQDVKLGHYGRALEEAVSTHKAQWPRVWEDKNPLSGSTTFGTMSPTERLTLLRAMILWSLSSSDAVKGLISQSYKQNRQEDDLNQPRSVQPWGTDADRRRYFLIEGQDDTAFRVYRESSATGINRTWWSVAGSIDDLRALSDKLETKDGGPKAKNLSQKIQTAIPRFEAGDEKRKRREYRLIRKEQFKRPESGFSLYEGRTRGKRMKYTYSDDEDISFSDSTTRRSTRNGGTATPAETGPVTTQSGRQIRAPTRLNVEVEGGVPGSTQANGLDHELQDHSRGAGRPRRSAATAYRANQWRGSRSQASMSVDSDEGESEAGFGDDEEDVEVPEESEDEDEYDEDEAMVEDDLDDQPRPSLMVKLSITPPSLRIALAPTTQAATLAYPSPALQDWGQLAAENDAKESITVKAANQPPTAPPSLPGDTQTNRDQTAAAQGSQPSQDVVKTPSSPAKIELSDQASHPKLSEVEPTSLAFRGNTEQAAGVDATYQAPVSHVE